MLDRVFSIPLRGRDVRPSRIQLAKKCTLAILASGELHSFILQPSDFRMTTTTTITTEFLKAQ